MESTELLRWVEIDLDALTHNVKAIRQHLRPGTQFMAVLKKMPTGME